MALSKSARQSLALAAVALLGAIVALSGSFFTNGSRPAETAASGRHSAPPKAPPASSAELALLAPIAPGKSFEGWTVRSVSGVHDGGIRIELERGKERVTLRIHSAKGGPSPPATSGPYAVYYSAKSATEGDRLARALAEALGRHVDKPVPPGLSEFREEGHNL